MGYDAGREHCVIYFFLFSKIEPDNRIVIPRCGCNSLAQVTFVLFKPMISYVRSFHEFFMQTYIEE